MAIKTQDKFNEIYFLVELASLMTEQELMTTLADMGQKVSDRYDFITKKKFEPIHPGLQQPLQKCLQKFGV